MKKSKNKAGRKGFTLIELLVVIAIIAILAIVVILTLNPAALLQQARDSNRISDMATLKSAISLYLADVSSPSLGTAFKCFLDNTNSTGTNCTGGGAGSGQSLCPDCTAIATSTSRAVDSTGWVPVNFNNISSGAPIGQLPLDPTNNAVYFYSYIPSTSTTLTFKVAAQLESSKYASYQINDGGTASSSFENGTNNAL